MQTLKIAQKKLAVNYSCEDIYRKYLSDKPATSVNQDKFNIQVLLTFHKSNRIHFLQSGTTISNLFADNQKNQTSVSGSLSGTGLDQTIIWAMSNGKYLTGLRGQFRKSTYSAEPSINSYPISDDTELNKYFLDWLPLTFGNPVYVDMTSQINEIGGWYSRPVLLNSRLRFQLSRTVSKNFLNFKYINSTNKDTLNGIRQIDIPINLEQNHLAISLIRPKSNLSSVTIIYLGARFAYLSDNHPPPASDFSSLGDGFIEYRSLSLSSNYKVLWHQFTAGMSYSNFYGDFKIQTPVLGYTVLLIFPVPIAHKASGHIRDGKAFSQNFKYMTNFRIRHTEVQFSVNYIHSSYRLRIDGSAQLELGLISTPVNYPLKIDANIFNIHFQLQRRIDRFSIIYSAHQIVPIIKRFDDSPIKFTEKIPGKKIRERGGMVHQMGIEYYF